MLLRHPAVMEAAVVGRPDERWGEAPHAFIVVKPDRAVTSEELREFSRAHLAHFKTPHSFTVVTSLPKTATGKIQKFVLRAGRAAIAVTIIGGQSLCLFLTLVLVPVAYVKFDALEQATYRNNTPTRVALR